MSRLLFCFTLAASWTLAQTSPVSRIDEIFKQWNNPDSPGASVAVVKDGQIVFKKGYGSADLEHAAPITPETVFHVASVSKQFTAMALVLLEQDGKLALRHIRHGDSDLTPVFADQFRGTWWFAGEVRFTRDEQGRVNGVRLGERKDHAVRDQTSAPRDHRVHRAAAP